MSRQKRKTPKVGWCPQCGPLTAGALDEDGCCALCGADATGPGADKALRLLKRADPAKERALRAAAIRALAQIPPSGRYVESVVLHSILGHIEASMQHTHGVDCRGFDDGDDINSDGDCGCGLVSASKARAALAALEGVKP